MAARHQHDETTGLPSQPVEEPTAATLARRNKPTGDVPRSGGASGDGDPTPHGDTGGGDKRSSESQDIGSFIRAQREAAEVSIRQLAERAGVSNPYLSQIERGLRKPSAEVLGQIARGLRLSAEVLYARAGILELKQGSPVRDAILTSPDLTERQREVLVEIYESFRANNATAADQVVDVP
jgi:transcriptional regulator with XRE-family HTH domain